MDNSLYSKIDCSLYPFGIVQSNSWSQTPVAGPKYIHPWRWRKQKKYKLDLRKKSDTKYWSSTLFTALNIHSMLLCFSIDQNIV